MEQFIYPVDRLLAEAAVFSYISEQADIPLDVLQEAFYNLFETYLAENEEYNNLDVVSYEFEGEDFCVSFPGTGYSIVFKLQEGGLFSCVEEEKTSMEVWSTLFREIQKKLPEEWKEDFCLREVPSKRNNWLLNKEKDYFEGEIYRSSDVEHSMGFRVSFLGEGKGFHVEFSTENRRG